MFFHSFIVKYGLKYNLLNLVRLVSDHNFSLSHPYTSTRRSLEKVLNKDPTVMLLLNQTYRYRKRIRRLKLTRFAKVKRRTKGHSHLLVTISYDMIIPQMNVFRSSFLKSALGILTELVIFLNENKTVVYLLTVRIPVHCQVDLNTHFL